MSKGLFWMWTHQERLRWLEAQIAHQTLNVAEWKRDGVYDGRRVNGEWIAREEGYIRELRELLERITADPEWRPARAARLKTGPRKSRKAKHDEPKRLIPVAVTPDTDQRDAPGLPTEDGAA